MVYGVTCRSKGRDIASFFLFLLLTSYIIGSCTGVIGLPQGAGNCQSNADCTGMNLPDDCPNGFFQCLDDWCKPICGDPNNAACISSRLSLPQDAKCKSECEDCDCDTINISCDSSCEQTQDCIVKINGNSAVSDDPLLSSCQIACQLNNSNPIECQATDCDFPRDQIQLLPDKVTKQGAAVQFDRQREDVDMVVVVDTSDPGNDSGAHSSFACAIEAYFEKVNHLNYSVGVLTADICGLYNWQNPYNMSGGPRLVGFDGVCDFSISNCDFNSCGGTVQACKFSKDGKMIQKSDTDAEAKIKRLIVQGHNECWGINGNPLGPNGEKNACSKGLEPKNICEGGLEKAFRYVFELIKEGKVDQIPNQFVFLTDEKAYSDGHVCPVQELRYESENLKELKDMLGDDFDPPANTGIIIFEDFCDQDLINFYSYFFNRYGIQINAAVTSDPAWRYNYGEVYFQVAEKTGGTTSDYHQCQGYLEFLDKVGSLAAEISQQSDLCLDQVVASPVELAVTYLGDGTQGPEKVPNSNNDGWSHNPENNCIQLNGSWADKYGGYQVEFKDSEIVISSEACFPSGIDPIPSSIRVYNQDQLLVPKSDKDGWTFDAATDCLGFHGSWMDQDGPFRVEYL